MKYEEEILKKCGKGNPFGVPDGYFNNLSQRIMDSLPEKDLSVKHVAINGRHRLLWRFTSIAAAFVGGIFVAGLYMHHANKPVEVANIDQSVNAEQLSDQDVETMVRSSHMDDYSLYKYLSDSGK